MKAIYRKDDAGKMDQSQFHITNVIERIDVFKGLEVKEMRSILHACSINSFQPTQQIYEDS